MADYFKTTLRTRPYSNLGIDYTNTITKGLLSAVPFLERGGGSVLDSVSQNNYYIDHGAAGVYDGDGFTTPVNVTDAKISLGSLLDGVVKDQLTVAALIRVNVTPGTNRSFFGCGNPLATFAYSCFSKSTGEFGFSINSSSSGVAFSTYKPYSGEICLVVLRYDGENLSGWVNGVQVLPDTARTGDVNNLTQSVTIGYTGSTSVKTASATHMFHAIWNRALTEGEIRRLSDNPWQLFQSIPLLLNTSTGSGTTSLVVADCADAVSSDSPTLVQQHTLISVDGTHISSSDSPTLAQQHVLVAADGSHAVSSDVPTLVQQHLLTIDNSINIITSDEVNLDVSTQLEVANSGHAVASDTPTLTQAHTLVVADGINVIASDVPTLVQNITLVVADATDVVTSDEVSLSSLIELIVADGSSAVVSDVVDLITSFGVSDSSHVVTSDSPTLVQQHILAVADSYLAVTSDNISSFTAKLLVVNDSYLIVTSDVVTLLTPTGASGRAKAKLMASSSRNILQVADTYCSFRSANSRVELGR